MTPSPLAPFDFSDFIAERTHDFTGREWVFDEIERWLDNPEGPTFFVITGEPGIGKSAIAARLTQACDNLAAYHFCIARDATTIDPTLFARSLSLQLCRIDGFALGILEENKIDLRVVQNIQANYGSAIGARIGNLTVNAPSGAAAFTHAVIQPLKALFTHGYDEKVILLVDALDEAVQHTGSETIVDLLANAGALPSQVRLVLTSRPEGSVLRQFDERQIPHLRLDAGRPENLADIRRYVHRQLGATKELRTRLAAQDVLPEAFVDRVTAASQGNFLYVVWLLSAIAAGSQRFDVLAVLPQGLDGIYREFLRTRRTQDQEQWRRTYEPLLGILAAAQAPLTREQVAQFTGLTVQEVRYGLEDLRQFTDPTSAEQGRYFLYHQSIRDWLQDEARAQEFWVDVESAHQRIVEHYQSTFDTNWNKLDDYALRYIAYHLLHAGASFHEQLFQLIDSDWRRLKLDRLHSDFSFTQDVEHALRAARDEGIVGLPRYISLSLMAGSIATKSNDVIPEAIGAMVALGHDRRAEAYLQTTSEHGVRSGALLQMARCYWLQQNSNQARRCFERALEVGKEADGIYMNPTPLIDDLLKMELDQEAVAVLDLFHTRMKTAWNEMLRESEHRLVYHLIDTQPDRIDGFRDIYPETFGRLVRTDGSIDSTCMPTRLEYKDYPIVPPPAEQVELFERCNTALDMANKAIERNDRKEAIRQLDAVENWGRNSNWNLQEFGVVKGTASEPWWRLIVMRGLVGPQHIFEHIKEEVRHRIAPWGESGWVARYAYGAALGELAIQQAIKGRRAKAEEVITETLMYCETIGGMETSVDLCKADLANLLYRSGYQALAGAVGDTYVMESRGLTSPHSLTNENGEDLVQELRRLADQWPIGMAVNAWRVHHEIQDILNSNDPQIIHVGVRIGATGAQILSEILLSLDMHNDEILAQLEQYVDLVTAGEWEATRHLWPERYPGVLYCGVLLDYIATRNCDTAVHFLHKFFDKARRNGRHACWVHLVASVPALTRLAPDMLESVWALVEPIERWHQNSVMTGKAKR